MKTIIISTSLNPESKGAVMSEHISEKLSKLGHKVQYIDLRDYDIPHVMRGNEDTKKLKSICETADNFIFTMGIYNYNVNDSFASFVGSCLPKKPFQFYGLIVTAGGDMSFLSTSSAHQMLMTHNRMIPHPQSLYLGSNFDGDLDNISTDLEERITGFVTDFSTLSHKLI